VGGEQSAVLQNMSSAAGNCSTDTDKKSHSHLQNR